MLGAQPIPQPGSPARARPRPPGHPDSELPPATCSEGAGAVTAASPRLRAPQPGWPPLCWALLRAPWQASGGSTRHPNFPSWAIFLPERQSAHTHTARAPRRPPPSPPQRPKRAPRASALRSARASARAAQLPTPRAGAPARPPARRLRLPHFQSSHVPFPSRSSLGSPRAAPLHSAPGPAQRLTPCLGTLPSSWLPRGLVPWGGGGQVHTAPQYPSPSSPSLHKPLSRPRMAGWTSSVFSKPHFQPYP